MKKNYDIPSLNLGSMTARDGARTQVMTEKNSIDNDPGFNSERSIHKKTDSRKRHDILSSSPKKGQPDQNDPAINLFFYKNFNKFIQNLYVQDEKGCQKLIADGKMDSKLANNPYSKEIAAMNASMKKASQPQTKKTNTSVKHSQNTKNRSNQNHTIITEQKKFSNSFMKPSTPREKDYNKKECETSPRVRLEQNFDLYKKHLEDKDAKNKLINNLVKSVSFKGVPTLDLSRVKAGDKAKTKHFSPRDK